VRELQNLVERAVILSNDGVLPNPLPAAERPPVTPATLPSTFRDSQRALILQALQAAGWVIGGAGGAATRLGLKRTTLIAKMRKLGISRPGQANLPGEPGEQELEGEQLWNVAPARNPIR
jgi:transcriptional regulator with GAF, ATPase, and Fis domain